MAHNPGQKINSSFTDHLAEKVRVNRRFTPFRTQDAKKFTGIQFFACAELSIFCDLGSFKMGNDFGVLRVITQILQGFLIGERWKMSMIFLVVLPYLDWFDEITLS